MIAEKIKHDVPSWMINRAAASVVGGYKIMGSILNLSKELMAKESEPIEHGSGSRNDLDRIQMSCPGPASQSESQ